MRATGSRASRRAASAATASISLAVESAALCLRRQRRVVEPERVADQDARVELGRVEPGIARNSRSERRRARHATNVSRRDRRDHDVFRREQLGLMLGHQRVDDLAERFAFDDLRQLVEREIDAVVGDAALREIVGADALGAVAGADLAAPLGGARGVELLALVVVEPRAQHRHRLGAVAMLRAVLLHHDHDAGRKVGARGSPIRSC